MLRDNIIEIFVNVDNFCKEITLELEKQLIEDAAGFGYLQMAPVQIQFAKSCEKLQPLEIPVEY